MLRINCLKKCFAFSQCTLARLLSAFFLASCFVFLRLCSGNKNSCFVTDFQTNVSSGKAIYLSNLQQAASLICLCLQNPPQQRYSWNSLNGRQAWEDEFQRLFLTPIFSNTVNIINQAQNIMLNAGKLDEKPLQR